MYISTFYRNEKYHLFRNIWTKRTSTTSTRVCWFWPIAEVYSQEFCSVSNPWLATTNLSGTMAHEVDLLIFCFTITIGPGVSVSIFSCGFLKRFLSPVLFDQRAPFLSLDDSGLNSFSLCHWHRKKILSNEIGFLTCSRQVRVFYLWLEVAVSLYLPYSDIHIQMLAAESLFYWILPTLWGWMCL